jgi:ribosomal-protein-alanine N-acetyltransferase
MIRPYVPTDKIDLLDLLNHHIPKYFAPCERQDFAAYLDNEREDYYVVEDAGVVVAGGGINYLREGREARISWDMVHPEYQGRGVGSELTLFRLNEIRQRPGIRTVTVRTSQMAYQFYEKFGFRLGRIEKDFWDEGYDLYEMRMNVDSNDLHL